NWSPTGVPGENDTANILNGSGQVEVNDFERVDTLNLGTSGSGAAPTLLVDSGPASEFLMSGISTNSATLTVEVNSNLAISGSLNNNGTLIIGQGVSRSSSGTANLKILGSVSLSGSGTVDLGGSGNQLGNIVIGSPGVDEFFNDTTIVGAGSI